MEGEKVVEELLSAATEEIISLLKVEEKIVEKVVPIIKEEVAT